MVDNYETDFAYSFRFGVLSLGTRRLMFLKRNGLNTIVTQISQGFEPDDTNQTAFSNPLAIESLRQRDYQGSEVTIEETLFSNALYTSYKVSYQSDGFGLHPQRCSP